MPEKKFMISPEKRIFSRVEQECEPGMQAWNGSVPEAGQRRSASVGRGTNQERARQGRGDKGEGKRKRRREQKAGGAKGMRERGGEGKGRAKRREAGKGEPRGRALAEGELEHGGEERKDAAGRSTARRKEGGRNRRKATAALGNLNCHGAAEICRRGARRHRAERCPRRKNCVRTESAPHGQGGDA